MSPKRKNGKLYDSLSYVRQDFVGKPVVPDELKRKEYREEE